MSVLLRLSLGGVFLVAGLQKVAEPRPLAEDIASFQLLPLEVVPWIAAALPVLEILVAGLLLTGLRPHLGAFSASVLLGAYTLALVSAWLRGLPVECACFGAPTSLAWALIRDVLLLAAATWLYREELRRAGFPE